MTVIKTYVESFYLGQGDNKLQLPCSGCTITMKENSFMVASFVIPSTELATKVKKHTLSDLLNYVNQIQKDIVEKRSFEEKNKKEAEESDEAPEFNSPVEVEAKIVIIESFKDKEPKRTEITYEGVLMTPIASMSYSKEGTNIIVSSASIAYLLRYMEMDIYSDRVLQGSAIKQNVDIGVSYYSIGGDLFNKLEQDNDIVKNTLAIVEYFCSMKEKVLEKKVSPAIKESEENLRIVETHKRNRYIFYTVLERILVKYKFTTLSYEDFFTTAIKLNQLELSPRYANSELYNIILSSGGSSFFESFIISLLPQRFKQYTESFEKYKKNIEYKINTLNSYKDILDYDVEINDYYSLEFSDQNSNFYNVKSVVTTKSNAHFDASGSIYTLENRIGAFNEDNIKSGVTKYIDLPNMLKVPASNIVRQNTEYRENSDVTSIEVVQAKIEEDTKKLESVLKNVDSFYTDILQKYYNYMYNANSRMSVSCSIVEGIYLYPGAVCYIKGKEDKDKDYIMEVYGNIESVSVIIGVESKVTVSLRNITIKRVENVVKIVIDYFKSLIK